MRSSLIEHCGKIHYFFFFRMFARLQRKIFYEKHRKEDEILTKKAHSTSTEAIEMFLRSFAMKQ